MLPHMKVPPDIKKFRFAILPPTILIFSGGMVGSLLLLRLLLGAYPDGRELAMGAAAMALISPAYVWLLTGLFPNGFSAAGVYGHSFWALRRFIAWPDIYAVRPFWLFNCKYLRIYTRDGKTIWLPLFQVQRSDFCQEIRKFAPPESPLLKHM